MYVLLLIIAYILGLLTPAPLFLALVLVIALRYRGYWCLFVAALIDIQFSLAYTFIPVYTLLTLSILIGAELLRPRLRVGVAV